MELQNFTAEPKHEAIVFGRRLRPGKLDPRSCLSLATRSARDPIGPALRLPHERRILPRLAGSGLREHKLPTSVAWGANDPSFIAAGATAFRADLPDAEIHLLDAGHFALEEKNDEIARLILDFYGAPSGLGVEVT